MTFSPMTSEAVALQVQPLIHVDDVTAAVRFYETLGGRLIHANDDGDFALLKLGSTCLALLGHPPNPAEDSDRIELTLTTDRLDAVADHLADTAITISAPITDTSFGRQMQITTPDGHPIKINQYR